MTRYLYDKNLEHSSCGVGFITNKNSEQAHELLEYAHQALCKIPHRGGMSSEGIGDGAGVNVDISLSFFRHITSSPQLELGEFGVANFFYPRDPQQHAAAEALIKDVFATHKLPVLVWRDVEVNPRSLNTASQKVQLNIKQIVFARPKNISNQDAFEDLINTALLAVEQPAFTQEALNGLYPLSMSSRTQVYKGRLNSWEVIPYFQDLNNPKHKIHTLFFHTRFSTNTAPNAMFAQPFRRMAHNGELNTDRKNRLSETAIGHSQGNEVLFPKGQSDSARLDQTLARRINEDLQDIDTTILAMMPPAWENDESLSPGVRDMLEYFSLYEEKNDGPAAIIFSDGTKVGARLDRLGLRPLRSVETADYLAVMSEAGQIDFPAKSILHRGRIEAGGMIVFDHKKRRITKTKEILEELAAEKDYGKLVQLARIELSDLPVKTLADTSRPSHLNISACHVAYSMNQESFKFMLDPMLQNGMEKISAMGYGLAPNALAKDEGGMSRYFSQRFAQVTNPPLDSIREADGMTLRVALGAKPNFSPAGSQQLIIQSPILQPQQLAQIVAQKTLRIETVETLFTPDFNDSKKNQKNLENALKHICDQVEALASDRCDIIILSDVNINKKQAAIPAMLAIASTNQRLIQKGLRFNASIIFQTGQASSTHDIACLLGFGASAICPITVYYRALELFDDNEGVATGLKNFQKAVEKALMKTMGKFGLCTAESYIGGEFFEANFIDTKDPVLAEIFPNIHSPVGGARFADIALSAANWHQKIASIQSDNEIPLLGLFKERAEGAAHGYGATAVREFVKMTEEDIQLDNAEQQTILPEDDSYLNESFTARTHEEIDDFVITPAYREFCTNLYAERNLRPATLRDVLALPLNFERCKDEQAFSTLLSEFHHDSNIHCAIQGLQILPGTENNWSLVLNSGNKEEHQALLKALEQYFGKGISQPQVSAKKIQLHASKKVSTFFQSVVQAPSAIQLTNVQPAHEITASLASGAMSHGALVAKAHIAVAQGTNMAGAMSNSGEGGEQSNRYNSISASKIKQFASGRFGVWTGYLADPSLEEIEIKIAQGAKPGEGGQLPAAKVTVAIAAARGGTPGVELVSPPPHHDTYSIEDLGQLIHDAKAARVRVVVKLVSSEGVGTIAVGVAKAGADVINIAGGTGGTGAAQVTSLKNTGRAADIGIAEVHQSLAENGLRDKVVLRCSNSHQTGLDVVKSAMLGGDSFEFGTTALMMLKCVMAKNCNVKCPAGLTTNAELYEGDPRALTQYFLNLAHEVREILASIGYTSLRAIRGQTQLLHLVNHTSIVGQLDMSGMLRSVYEMKIDNPVYLEADFVADNNFITQVKAEFFEANAQQIELIEQKLNNCNKTTGGQFSVDIERHLNYTMTSRQRQNHPAVYMLENGRAVLADGSITIRTNNSAGQSYGAFLNSGITMIHTGTCNDGVGKGASGGRIVVKNPGGGSDNPGGNVLVGNFALFGATGGQLFVNGQAGDRFGVRNSGAVAVVRGVGDFCCEYMTNGAIINLGGYGKGFGNGMSGGMAYQYDPSGQIVTTCSEDSVITLPISEDSELARGQEQALLEHLQQYLQFCNSPFAQDLVDNWTETRQHFYAMIPRALFRYHTSDEVLASHTRKEMLEELSIAIGHAETTHINQSYAHFKDCGTFMFDGKVPGFSECDTSLISQYINTAGVLLRASEAAQKMNAVQSDPQLLDASIRKLIATEDRKLMDTLYKDAKEAMNQYSDEALACLLAKKRVDDYKESLATREVWDMQAFGVSTWIMERNRVLNSELAEHTPLKHALASHYSVQLANT